MSKVKRKRTVQYIEDKAIYEYNIYQLIHFFCNRIIKKDEAVSKSNGDYLFTRDYIKYNNRYIAVWYRGILYIDMSFDSSNGWGGGTSSWQIVRAADGVNRVVKYYTKIPIKGFTKRGNNPMVGFNSQTGFNIWYEQEWIEQNQNFFDSIAYLKHAASNSRVLAIGYIGMSNQNLRIINSFPYSFPEKRKTKIRGVYTRYNGWGSSGDSYYYDFEVQIGLLSKDFAVRDITKEEFVDYGFLTENELKEVNLKLFIDSYGRRHSNNNAFVYSLKEFRELYQDENWRREWISKRQKQKQLIEVQKNKELFINNALIIWHFINKGIRTWSNFPYAVLRLVGEKVQTSMGVSIPLKHAKIAYEFYKKRKQDQGRVSVYSYNGIIKLILPDIDFNSILSITDKEEFKDAIEAIYETSNGEDKEYECIVIGCHKIPFFEIERFMNHYNLEW